MQVLILAGGLGTRIQSVSGGRPKALIEIGGHPFVDYQLFWLAKQGVRDVVMSIGHKGDMIRSVVGDVRLGLNVVYADEGGRLRGTAGAIRYAADLGLLDGGFFVLYGDSYLPIEMKPVWSASEEGRVATMTVMRNQGRWDKSNVRYEAGQPLLYDKHCPDPEAAGMSHIDYGLMVLPAAMILESVPPGTPADLADVLAAASRQGQINGYEVTERFYEVGSPQGLQDFGTFIAANPQAIPPLLDPEARPSDQSGSLPDY